MYNMKGHVYSHNQSMSFVFLYHALFDVIICAGRGAESLEVMEAAPPVGVRAGLPVKPVHGQPRANQSEN